MDIPMTPEIAYSVILEPQVGGGFTVTVPALPEVATEGDSEAEALEMAKDAIALVLDHRRRRNLPIPSDILPEIRQVRIAAE
jgi:antitoxin HicB